MALSRDEIVKPRTDKREYRRIVLSNSLQVLLISDPETDKSAASMDVGVGSFSDPVGLEGLAHFLEHMLFYASEKYPLEDSYSKYISEHGGHTNAFTYSEQTNYHFDVNNDCFEEALDRFAQFFIKPLMSAEATMREIKAVDSECQMNLLSDAWRMSQLQKHLSNEGLPYHKFNIGNWETLEVRPKAKGLDTREELIKFYKEHYSANLMHLVIYAKESLDELQGVVEEKFQAIPNHERSCFSFPGQPFLSEHLQILARAVPIQEGHELRISWPITPWILHYKEGPMHYLSHLIGHEAEGSVFYALKTLGWATSLYASEGDCTSDFSVFEVAIDLTDAGHEHMQDVVGLLFKYIMLLQRSGVCKWIFDELAAVSQTEFNYRDKNDPINYIVGISYYMHKYPPEDWLVQSSMPTDFNPSTIQMHLDQLSQDNFRIFWISKKFEAEAQTVEPWFGTRYGIEKITSSTIQDWIHSAPDKNLHLPVPNVFVPTDLSVKDKQEKVTWPSLLRKSSYFSLWYKPDTLFFMPKAYITVDFSCPLASVSPEASVLTDIFTELLMDYLNEYAYYAQVAGLYYWIGSTNSGFQVTMVGYNHKLRVLLETVVKKVATFEVKPDRFVVIKEKMTKAYENYKFQQPYEQAMYYCSLILYDQAWPWTEGLEVLSQLQADDLSRFVPMLLSRAFLECYVAGNIEQDEAETISNQIEDTFFKGLNPICQPLFSSQHLANRVVKLDRGMSYIYPVEGLNIKDENSALLHYIQVHRDDIKLNVKLQLFALLAKQAAFHQLRTVEQLGYMTFLTRRNDSGIRGLQFVIQSTVKGPGQIDLRVENFLSMYESKLREMSNDEFKNNVNALINMKLEKVKNLSEESSYYWNEISEGTLKFDRKECEVAALRQLTQDELLDFFNDYIKIGAPQKRTLSIRVYGSPHSSELAADRSQELPPNCAEIEDILSFRRSQPLYASFKGGVGHMKL
ncbi:unnamed protein product [Linum trigynum]|uniref:Insulin-degrading enzyme-like 1, peroxisomal n=1 Tax=Linum trigynum TaxID=586398 RepID=A0AAV2C8G1_9ROSI